MDSRRRGRPRGSVRRDGTRDPQTAYNSGRNGASAPPLTQVLIQMDCKDFLSAYSDFHDGGLEASQIAEFEEHLASCASCRRYRRVVLQGIDLLRSFQAPPLRSDFQDRLRHRIYLSEVEDERRRRGGPAGPVSLAVGATALFVAGAALASMLPNLAVPSTTLPAVHARAPVGVSGVRPSEASAVPGARRGTSFLGQSDLWSQSHTLLFEYTPLYQQTREAALVRIGLQ